MLSDLMGTFPTPSVTQCPANNIHECYSKTSPDLLPPFVLVLRVVCGRGAAAVVHHALLLLALEVLPLEVVAHLNVVLHRREVAEPAVGPLALALQMRKGLFQ